MPLSPVALAGPAPMVGGCALVGLGAGLPGRLVAGFRRGVPWGRVAM